jgi:hypothetical protein
MVFEDFIKFSGGHTRKIYQFAGPLFKARVEFGEKESSRIK